MALTETNHAGEFLISEANGTRSRSTGVVSSGEGVLQSGQVLGKITATSELAAYDNTASDGTQAAVGILYARVDATSADAKCVFIDCDAEVTEERLIGLDTAARADLLALGIKIRA